MKYTFLIIFLLGAVTTTLMAQYDEPDIPRTGITDTVIVPLSIVRADQGAVVKFIVNDTLTYTVPITLLSNFRTGMDSLEAATTNLILVRIKDSLAVIRGGTAPWKIPLNTLSAPDVAGTPDTNQVLVYIPGENTFKLAWDDAAAGEGGVTLGQVSATIDSGAVRNASLTKAIADSINANAVRNASLTKAIADSINANAVRNAAMLKAITDTLSANIARATALLATIRDSMVTLRGNTATWDLNPALLDTNALAIFQANDSSGVAVTTIAGDALLIMASGTAGNFATETTISLYYGTSIIDSKLFKQAATADRLPWSLHGVVYPGDATNTVRFGRGAGISFYGQSKVVVLRIRLG